MLLAVEFPPESAEWTFFVAAAVLLVTADGLALAVVMVLAPLGVLLVRPFAPAAGTVPHEPVDDEPAMDVMVGSTGGFLGPLVLANGAAQALLRSGRPSRKCPGGR